MKFQLTANGKHWIEKGGDQLTLFEAPLASKIALAIIQTMPKNRRCRVVVDLLPDHCKSDLDTITVGHEPDGSSYGEAAIVMGARIVQLLNHRGGEK